MLENRTFDLTDQRRNQDICLILSEPDFLFLKQLVDMVFTYVDRFADERLHSLNDMARILISKSDPEGLKSHAEEWATTSDYFTEILFAMQIAHPVTAKLHFPFADIKTAIGYK